ncbi:hypothetical protein LTR56_015496 [Elasticomyces elasticus]|nr:hypothetical protein LTR56_015496 [Elasticomyces elasticus]KAK3662529.1 hypothetical protein LTR22_006595 [Elasticomyces elasticus]KAK4927873.1 hypothetical protein LTR49_005295 [Elasticomyces elasticus]KAK5750220.1 hypothetical protein LTS12_019709 [Elasticomyces elasticus]
MAQPVEDSTTDQHLAAPKRKRKATDDVGGIAKKAKGNDNSESDEGCNAKAKKEKSRLLKKTIYKHSTKRSGAAAGIDSSGGEVQVETVLLEEVEHAEPKIPTKTTGETTSEVVDEVEEPIVAAEQTIVKNSNTVQEPVVNEETATIQEKATSDKHHSAESIQSKGDTSLVAKAILAGDNPVVVAKPAGWLPHNGKKNTGQFEKFDKPMSGRNRQQVLRWSPGKSRSGLAYFHLPDRRVERFVIKRNRRDDAPPPYSVLDPLWT